MNGYAAMFVAEKDRRGRPLFRDAVVVGRVGFLTMFDWQNPTGVHHRTLVCDATGRMYAGVLGDSDHVERYMRRLIA